MSHLLADRCSRHIQSVFNSIMDIHVMVNWQLSKRYPLTSVTWLIAGASEQLIEVKCSFTVSVLINRRHWSIFFFRRNSLFLLTQKLNCLKKTFLKKSQKSFTVGLSKSILPLRSSWTQFSLCLTLKTLGRGRSGHKIDLYLSFSLQYYYKVSCIFCLYLFTKVSLI